MKQLFLISMSMFYFCCMSLSCKSVRHNHDAASEIAAYKQNQVCTPPQNVPRIRIVDSTLSETETNLAKVTIGIGLMPGETHATYKVGRPFCSGTVVETDFGKMVLTAAHCVEEAGTTRIGVMAKFESERSAQDRSQIFPITEAVFVDHRIDLALVKADLSPYQDALPLLISDTNACASIMGIGHPKGALKTIADQCRVISIGIPFIFTHNCKMTVGNSGTAVLSQADHSILGVLSSGVDVSEANSHIGSETAVHLFPLKDIVSDTIRGRMPIGYDLNTMERIYHFLKFNSQIYCPRTPDPVCNEAMNAVIATMTDAVKLEQLRNLLPSPIQDLSVKPTMGLTVRMRSSGKNSLKVGIIDYIYTDSGANFPELLNNWIFARLQLEKNFVGTSKTIEAVCPVNIPFEECHPAYSTDF